MDGISVTEGYTLRRKRGRVGILYGGGRLRGLGFEKVEFDGET